MACENNINIVGLWLRSEVGLEPGRHVGEQQGEQCHDAEGDGSGVNHIAQTHERTHDGSEHITTHADKGRSIAGTLASLVHGQGIGHGEEHAKEKDHGNIEGIVYPHIIHREEAHGLNGYHNHQSACGEGGRAFKRLEFQGRHGSGGHEQGVDTHEQAELQLIEVVVVLNDEGRR